MTLIITKEKIEKVLNMNEVVGVVEKAFKLYGLKKVQMPAKSYLYFDEGDLRSMPAYIKGEGLDIAGIKSVNVHPGNPKNHDMPTVMATILLIDPKTGSNIAVLDGTLITAMRTGAAGGVAAKYLAKENAKTAGFVGAGMQAHTQLDALMVVRKLEKIKVYDLSKEAAEKFCKEAEEKYGIKGEVVNTIEDACRDVDILTTTTPVRQPIVMKDYVTKGTHINAIGADAEGKEELEPELLKNSKVIIDDWAQASHSGEINIPVSKGLFKKQDVYAELGQVVAGIKKGRENDKEITIFDSTGLGIQDVATAFLAYEKLKDDKEVMDVRFF